MFPNNPRHFAVVLSGPEDTPYAGGVFHLELFLPEGYPMCPPKVRFLTKIYHRKSYLYLKKKENVKLTNIKANIDRLGRICLDVLKDKWSPALQIRTVLLSISVLLSSPVPDDPLDASIAEHFIKDREGANKKAREMTAQFAKS